jgi:hypothetical protein
MTFIPARKYQALLNGEMEYGYSLMIRDHLNGFNEDLSNSILEFFLHKNYTGEICSQYMFDDRILTKYPLDIKFDSESQCAVILRHFHSYTAAPRIEIDNFLCSFNGSAHLSRQLLVSCLHKFGWFNPDYSSKNFVFSRDNIDGIIQDYCGLEDGQYNDLILTDESFGQTIYCNDYVRFRHSENIYNLEDRLRKSFVHVVSETMATSYYPYITEKFLYSVVTKGLFVAYGQPGWHEHLVKNYGFKLYTKLFDYSFDDIQNPVKRLIALMRMLKKFDMLSYNDLHDLYLMEKDTIEFNYDHYYSNGYMEYLRKWIE